TTVLALSPAELRTRNPALFADVLNTARDLNPLQTPDDHARILTDPGPAPETHTDLRTEPQTDFQAESFAIDKTPQSLRSLQELSGVVDTEALLAFEAGPYRDLTPGQVLRARQIVAETIHFPTLLDATGDAGRHGHLKDWTVVAVAQALTSAGQQTATATAPHRATAVRQATDIAERIRRDRGLEQPQGLLGGTRPQETEQTRQTGQSSTQAQGSTSRMEDVRRYLSPAASAVHAMTPGQLLTASFQMPRDRADELTARAWQLLADYSAPDARPLNEEGRQRVEVLQCVWAVRHALHRAEQDEAFDAVAVELAQHYAGESAFSFRPAPRDTIGTSFPAPYQEQLGTLGYATGFPVESALVGQSNVQGPTGVDARLYVSQGEESDDDVMAGGSGDESSVWDQDQMEEEFEAITPAPGDEVMDVDEDDQSTAGGEGVVRSAMDAAFESAFGELLLGEDADVWESGLGADLGEEGGQGEDYLLFEDADVFTDGGGDERALSRDDADDAGSVRSEASWSSEVSAVSLAQELTVAGLRVLEQAADAEAHRWFAGRTGQEVRRRRAELLESWGQQVHEYPVLVEHLDRVLRAEPGETAPRERNELLLLLSLTPGGLAVPVEQLGKWLRPHQPPA
ncbi:hypothetical protein ACFU51_37955, partial [Streptomyces sp. NPDC057430]|uniref:hypothetical protein n=1 Tax=Streptomyces sp. NPDC057430 TaxID=3346131 RepID=UPI0036B7843F